MHLQRLSDEHCAIMRRCAQVLENIEVPAKKRKMRVKQSARSAY